MAIKNRGIGGGPGGKSPALRRWRADMAARQAGQPHARQEEVERESKTSVDVYRAALDKVEAEFEAVAQAPRQGAGRKPLKTMEVTSRMLEDIDAGRTTTEQLRDDTQEALARTYGCSRKPVVRARERVLLQCAELKGTRNIVQSKPMRLRSGTC